MKSCIAAIAVIALFSGLSVADAATWRIDASGTITSASGLSGSLPFASGDSASLSFLLDDAAAPLLITDYSASAGVNRTYGGAVSGVSARFGSYEATGRAPVGAAEEAFEYVQVHQDYVPSGQPGRAPQDGTFLVQWVTGAALGDYDALQLGLQMFDTDGTVHDSAALAGSLFAPSVLAGSETARLYMTFQNDQGRRGSVFGDLTSISATRLPDIAPVPLPAGAILLLSALAFLGPVLATQRKPVPVPVNRR